MRNNKSDAVMKQKLLELLEKLPCGGTLEELTNGLNTNLTDLRRVLLPLCWRDQVEAKPYRHPANGKTTYIFRLRKPDDTSIRI